MSHDGSRFDRLPESKTDRERADRPTRAAVTTFFDDRYGIDPDVFAPYSFWERGAGKIWAFRGDHSTPLAVEAAGIHVLRTNQRSWKLTTDGSQLLGRHAERNVLTVSDATARRFWRGEDQAVDWPGEDGYLIVARRMAGSRVPLGVGLYIDGMLRSMVPKGRQRELTATSS